jgi:hypothetical protein
MSRTQFTGKGKAFWVPDPTGAGTVVTLAAPTAVQVNTGTEITKYLRRNGLATPQTGNLVDTSDASNRFNSTDLGTFGGDKATIIAYRDTSVSSDNAWPLFAPGSRGFLIVLRFGTAGASPAAGDRCEVYQVGVVNRQSDPIADNQAQTFTCELAITAPANTDATLV